MRSGARCGQRRAGTPPQGLWAHRRTHAPSSSAFIQRSAADAARCAPALLARRAHSEALARSLAAARARSSRAQAPQAKVLSELIRLRRDFLTADRSVKQLQHETKMMRSAFQVRGAARRAPNRRPEVAIV